MKDEPLVKCDKCDKPAEYNLQSQWHLYEVKQNKKTYRYNELKSWEGDTNEHYCEHHAEIEGII